MVQRMISHMTEMLFKDDNMGKKVEPQQMKLSEYPRNFYGLENITPED